MPGVDAGALAAAPRLRAIVHAAGSVKRHVDPVVFDRGVAVCSAAQANAVPVAEYTVAAIVFATKRVIIRAHWYARGRAGGDWRSGTDTGLRGESDLVVGNLLSSAARNKSEATLPRYLEGVLAGPGADEGADDLCAVTRGAHVEAFQAWCHAAMVPARPALGGALVPAGLFFAITLGGWRGASAALCGEQAGSKSRRQRRRTALNCIQRR